MGRRALNSPTVSTVDQVYAGIGATDGCTTCGHDARFHVLRVHRGKSVEVACQACPSPAILPGRRCTQWTDQRSLPVGVQTMKGRA